MMVEQITRIPEQFIYVRSGQWNIRIRFGIGGLCRTFCSRCLDGLCGFSLQHLFGHWHKLSIGKNPCSLSLFLCKLKVFMMFIIVEIGNLCDTVSFLKTGTAVFTRRAFSSDPEEEDKLRIDRQQP